VQNACKYRSCAGVCGPSGALANATATLALPQIAPLVSQIALPIAAAELSIVFWLLIWGAQARPTGATPVPKTAGAD
jgi:hypothetical protein